MSQNMRVARLKSCAGKLLRANTVDTTAREAPRAESVMWSFKTSHSAEGESHRFHSGKIRLPWQQPAIVGKIHFATVLGESLILLVLERVDCPKCGQQSTHRDSARNCNR